jgi:hypothetical protein
VLAPLYRRRNNLPTDLLAHCTDSGRVWRYLHTYDIRIIIVVESVSRTYPVGGTSVFERLKRFTRPREPGGQDYVCQGCGAGFDVQRQVCTECGGYHIERTGWNDFEGT